MKTKTQAAANGKAPAQSKQARKTTGAPAATSAGEPHPDADIKRWKRENTPAAKLFKRLNQMQPPVAIHRHTPSALFPEEVGKDLERVIFFSRDVDGREHFFMEEPIFKRPEERWVKQLSRRDAFGIILLWSVPACLRDYMITVLKKGGAW